MNKSNNTIELNPETAAKQQLFEQLKEEFLAAFLKHSKLLTQDKDELFALYLELIGRSQHELFVIETDIALYKRLIDKCQAYFNRGEMPDIDTVESEAREELDELLKRIEKQAKLIDEARAFLSSPLMSEEDSKEMRTIYYALAKRLHPDLNPNQSEEEYLLFIQTKLAYERKDLERLKDIILAIDSKRPDTLTKDADSIEEKIEILKRRIAALLKRIEEIEASFPFNQRSLLFDEVQLNAMQEMLSTAIEEAKVKLEELKTKYQHILSCIKE